MEPRQLAQMGMNLDPGASAAPLAKIIVHSLPGAAGPQDVEDAIGDAAQVRGSRPSMGFAGRNQRGQQRLFFIIHIAGVHWKCHTEDALRKMLNSRFG
jgi:hypothetical protein